MVKLNFGDAIRKHRIELGMTQQELGDKVGAQPRTVSGWETNRTQPSQAQIESLCKLFGITEPELYGLSYSLSSGEKLFVEINKNMNKLDNRYLKLLKSSIQIEMMNRGIKEDD